mgnify:CR=1 FL=1
MKRKHTISVIIPAHERSEALREAVASVKGQTLAPDEIIVANNSEVRQATGSLGEGIHVLNLRPHIGPSAARNAGAAEANGGLLAFLDDDDLWDHRFLEEMYERYVSTGADCVVGDMKRLLPDGAVVPHYSFAAVVDEPRSAILFRNTGFGGGNILIDKKAFNAVGGFDERLRYSEDHALAVELVFQGYRLIGAPKAVCYVRDLGLPRLNMLTPKVLLRHRLAFFARFHKYCSFREKLGYLKLIFKAIKLCVKKRNENKITNIG